MLRRAMRSDRRLAYGFTLPTMGVAVLLAFALRSVWKPDFPGQISEPLILVAVAISAWYWGLGPGLVATTFGLLSLEVFFGPPLHEFSFDVRDVPRLTSFVLLVVLISTLNQRRQQAETTVRAVGERMRAARLIQQRLFPQAVPEVLGLDIAGVTEPADSTGGDYHDFVPMRFEGLGIIVGDVSGHGFGPALLMAETRAYLRALERTNVDVGTILTLCNEVLIDDMDNYHFCTLFFARLNRNSNNWSFAYAAAGHDGYLFDANGTIRHLESTGVPLGIQREAKIATASPISLTVGQTLVVLTDGVPESKNAAGELFGIDRALAVIRNHYHESARAMVDALLRTIREFTRDAARADDLTVVIVKASSPEDD